MTIRLLVTQQLFGVLLIGTRQLLDSLRVKGCSHLMSEFSGYLVACLVSLDIYDLSLNCKLRSCLAANIL